MGMGIIRYFCHDFSAFILVVPPERVKKLTQPERLLPLAVATTTDCARLRGWCSATHPPSCTGNNSLFSSIICTYVSCALYSAHTLWWQCVWVHLKALGTISFDVFSLFIVINDGTSVLGWAICFRTDQDRERCAAELWEVLPEGALQSCFVRQRAVAR